MTSPSSISIELEVRAGLTVLTGETGAGKSIVVDALQLLAGGKGGAEVVRAGAERAEISATFDISDSAARAARLARRAVDRSRRRAHGAPRDRRRRPLARLSQRRQSVPLQLLREVGAHPRRHPRAARIPVADARRARSASCSTTSASTIELAARCAIAHASGSAASTACSSSKARRAIATRASNCCATRCSELKALDLKDGEVAQLTEERTRLRIAAGSPKRRRRRSACSTTPTKAMRTPPRRARWPASRHCRASIRGSPRSSRMVDEAAIQIREAARELSRYLETLDIDPARQDEVERRLAAIEELGRKHRVPPEELASRARAAREASSPSSSAPTTISTRCASSRPRRSRAIASSRTQLSRGAPDRGARACRRTSPRACRRWAWPAAAS